MQTKERTKLKLEASGRITPREVLEAYERTGTKPDYGDWDHCAFAALVHAHGYFNAEHDAKFPGSPLALDIEEFIEDRGSEWCGLRYVASEYQAGFVRGFDGHSMPPEPGDDSIELGCWEWEKLGWLDGRRVRRFVFRAE